MNYPETKRINIDDWSIISDGIMKGIYHNCTFNYVGWKQRATKTSVTNDILFTKLLVDVNHCPACNAEVPKDVEAIACTMGV